MLTFCQYPLCLPVNSFYLLRGSANTASLPVITKTTDGRCDDHKTPSQATYTHGFSGLPWAGPWGHRGAHTSQPVGAGQKGYQLGLRGQTGRWG